MFLAIQVVLLAVGLVIMSRGKYEIAGRVIVNPIASLVGIILAAQLPIALIAWMVLWTSEPAAPTVAVPTRAGEAAPVANVAPPRSVNENWWVDPLITCGALLAAAALTGIAMRTDSETEEVLAGLTPAETDAAQ
jgi:hypothetical protein